MNIQPQLILFDLDGTLIDSAPDLAHCIDEMMQRLGRRPHGEVQVRQWIGNGMQRLVKRALVGEIHGEPPISEFDHAYTLFLQLYAEHYTKKSVVYPGVQECLTRLKIWQYPLVCVTNKNLEFVKPLLHHLNLQQYFSLVIAGDTLAYKKPDPAQLLHAAAHFNVAPTQALMIGDSMNDVMAARAAGFAVICVSYGYNHGQDISLAKPDAVIDSLIELIDILRKS